jgi:hypothetical protein
MESAMQMTLRREGWSWSKPRSPMAHLGRPADGILRVLSVEQCYPPGYLRHQGAAVLNRNNRSTSAE